MNAESALRFVNVEHHYGDLKALQRISFQVQPGQVLCLLGASGCGKTTALRVAAGLERPHAGQVQVAGRVVTDETHFIAPEARGVGLLFQDYALFPHLNVANNVMFGLEGLSRAEKQQRAEVLLACVSLSHRWDAFPHMLSGGEQQRIALARALAPKPAVLLLDEPFSNLDTLLRQQVRDQVLETLKEMGSAALMVTHDPEEALYMGDQIALMECGQIVQQGTPSQLYHHPVSPSVASFFGALNTFESQVRAGAMATPFGPLATTHFAEGDEVVVYIRSEGLTLYTEPDQSPHARVLAVRPLGRLSLIHLQTLPSTGFDCALHVHVLGMSDLEPGMSVCVRLDPTLTFAFAR